MVLSVSFEGSMVVISYKKVVTKREDGGRAEGVRGWLGDNDEMPNDEMPDHHAPAYLSPSPPSPPDMCLKSKSDGACLIWFSIHGLGVGDSLVICPNLGGQSNLK
jgi:hypothetical protein